MQLEFVKPDTDFLPKAKAFRDAFYAAGERTINGGGGLDFFDTLTEWLDSISKVESGDAEGLVPSARIHFARDLETGQIVGVIDIRPALPGNKRHFGHLGYSTLPGVRRKGIATGMVEWGVQELRRMGVGDILASVYAENTASIKVLEKSGFLQKGMFREEESGKEIIQYVNIK